MVAGKSGTVVAASFFGKMKTVSQIIGFILIFMDPVICSLLSLSQNRLISYIAMGIMTLTTVFSGLDYARALAPMIDTNK